jgi:hypothetical protein
MIEKDTSVNLLGSWLSLRDRYQYSFMASWISREVRWKSTGAPAELMVPAAVVPIDALGLLNWGVLAPFSGSKKESRGL